MYPWLFWRKEDVAVEDTEAGSVAEVTKEKGKEGIAPD